MPDYFTITVWLNGSTAAVYVNTLPGNHAAILFLYLISKGHKYGVHIIYFFILPLFNQAKPDGARTLKTLVSDTCACSYRFTVVCMTHKVKVCVPL